MNQEWCSEHEEIQTMVIPQVNTAYSIFSTKLLYIT